MNSLAVFLKVPVIRPPALRFVQLNSTETGAANLPNMEETSVFALSGYQYIIMAVVVTKGYPHKKPLYHNCKPPPTGSPGGWEAGRLGGWGGTAVLGRYCSTGAVLQYWGVPAHTH